MIEDDFQNLREKINQADALVFSTPVYYGDLSESAKRFLDRWRRCESVNRETSPLRGKLAIGIAAAGVLAEGLSTPYTIWRPICVFSNSRYST